MIFPAIAVALVLIVLGALSMFPVGVLKGPLERELTRDSGRPATVDRIVRESGISFDPVMRIEGVHVPQPQWAGSGELASVATIRMRLPILPLLIGRVHPSILSVAGAKMDLVRAADGRENWRNASAGQASGTSMFEAVQSIDAQIRYRDAKQQRGFVAGLRIDSAGLHLGGNGQVGGSPVSIEAHGPALTADQPWPFEASVDGPALGMHVTGKMAAPLRTDQMQFHIIARADDLKRIDRVIEAGLFGTQPVQLEADAEHARPRWTVTGVHGAIGVATQIAAGKMVVDKQDGRTRLDGGFDLRQLDFDDLASNSGRASAAALEQREGPKFVPNTRVNLHKLTHTDGRITVHVARIVGQGDTLRDADAVLTLDHQRLSVEPLRFGLSKGALTGRVIVDQHGDPEPTVSIALNLTGTSLNALAGSKDGVDARVDGRVRLTGPGSTIREAIGRSDGSIGLIARDGVIPAKLASLLGFDLGRALTTSDDREARLRCAAIGLAVRHGHGTLDPLLLDTDRSQARGTGTIDFPEERIAATLTGAPKRDSLLRLPGDFMLAGTIRQPKFTVPKQVKSVGNIFKAIGRTLRGDQGPTAADADCAALGHRLVG